VNWAIELNPKRCWILMSKKGEELTVLFGSRKTQGVAAAGFSGRDGSAADGLDHEGLVGGFGRGEIGDG